MKLSIIKNKIEKLTILYEMNSEKRNTLTIESIDTLHVIINRILRQIKSLIYILETLKILMIVSRCFNKDEAKVEIIVILID